MSTPDLAWKATRKAAKELGISPDSLKRQRDARGGFLVAQVDYIPSWSPSASIIWHVERCRQKFSERGAQLQRQGLRSATNPTEGEVQ